MLERRCIFFISGKILEPHSAYNLPVSLMENANVHILFESIVNNLMLRLRHWSESHYYK